MAKKTIALIAGGDTGEYVISIQSAQMIENNLDPALFEVYTIVIRFGKWVYTDSHGQEVPVDRNDFSICVDGQKILFDCAFITIHGTPGEDGKLQAYFELLGIPYTTAGVLASALTFNKYYCNRVVAEAGFTVPKAVRLTRNNPYFTDTILQSVNLPVFVKPNEGGSSLGMSFVKEKAVLRDAIERAFEHDDAVMVEEFIDGTELTCGAYRKKGAVKVLPVTEIISKTEADFFDYEAKYTKGAADEITPAHITDELKDKVQNQSALLYEQLNLSGLVRFDFIHRHDQLYFLEVNVTPGMTPTSLVPQQAAVAGISNTDLFTIMIEEALAEGGEQ